MMVSVGLVISAGSAGSPTAVTLYKKECKKMKKGYLYILQCADGSLYTGSTHHLEARIYQHQQGEGANYTKSRLPVHLVYVETYERIDEAYYREKQIQGWRRKKKQALIAGDFGKLSHLAKAYQ